jgi:hypothetical protein
LLSWLFIWSGLGRNGNYLRLFFFSEIETSLVALSAAWLVVVVVVAAEEVVDLVLVVEAVEHPPFV